MFKEEISAKETAKKRLNSSVKSGQANTSNGRKSVEVTKKLDKEIEKGQNSSRSNLSTLRHSSRPATPQKTIDSSASKSPTPGLNEARIPKTYSN